MIFEWYKIFNLLEFEALNLVSKEYTLDLEGRGEKTFLVSKAGLVAINYEGVMLGIGLEDENPFIFEGFAVYLDENNDVHFGFEVES